MAINPNTNFTAGAVFTAAQANRFPRGVMARSVLTANVTFPAVADTGLSCTFTADSTRLYKISYSAFASSSQTGLIFTFITDSANTAIKEMLVSVDVANGQTNHTNYTTVSGISGSVTYKIRALNQNGTGTFYGASPASAIMLVEDIGPA